jgi:hypothetical protein
MCHLRKSPAQYHFDPGQPRNPASKSIKPHLWKADPPPQAKREGHGHRKLADPNRHRRRGDRMRRRRASSRGGDRLMTESPSPLTMLLSRHTRRREFIGVLDTTALLDAWGIVAAQYFWPVLRAQARVDALRKVRQSSGLGQLNTILSALQFSGTAESRFVCFSRRCAKQKRPWIGPPQRKL